MAIKYSTKNIFYHLYILMKKIIWIVGIALVILAWGIYFFHKQSQPLQQQKEISVETSPSSPKQLQKCQKLKQELDKLPQDIALFWENLHLTNIDCKNDLSGDPYEEDSSMFNAQLYQGKKIIATHSKETLPVISIGRATSFKDIPSPLVDAGYLPVADITNEIEISGNQKELLWEYKIIANIGPSWEIPATNWSFTISILGKSWNIMYYNERKDIQIPELSELIKQAVDSTSESGSYSMQKLEAFNKLVERYNKDLQEFDSKSFDTITYSSMQYISELIKNNEAYKNFLIEQARELLQEMGISL